MHKKDMSYKYKQLQKEFEELKEEYKNEVDENCKLSELWCKSQNNWNELKEELKREYQEYYCGWHAQDMATTYRVAEHLEVLDKVITKMQEIESRK